MGDTTSPEKTEKGAESPTTARPIDFDDDQQETGVTSGEGNTVATPTRPPRTSSTQRINTGEEAPPPKPPRPADAQAHAEATLIEAFPGVDAKVVKAVLIASGGQIEPAFNALLGMSDPDFVEETPPIRPPRPTQDQREMSQVDRDEMYARQLAAQYDQAHAARGQQQRDPYAPQGQRRAQRPGSGEDDREYSFFDDDLPAIRENVRQGFLQTQTKVNKWITDFRKRIDGEDEDEIGPGPASQSQAQRQNFGPSQKEQMYGIQKMSQRNAGRRSTDQDRYDADPHVLSDNFTELELHDEEAPPKKPARPQANPDLFKPTPAPPQSGPVDEVDALYREASPNTINRQPSPSSGGKSKKWQPLTSVAPAPEDNDPFSLGDSDEEAKTKDINEEATKRLKKAASESGPKPEGAKTLEESERSGSVGQKSKDAEDLLKGKTEE